MIPAREELRRAAFPPLLLHPSDAQQSAKALLKVLGVDVTTGQVTLNFVDGQLRTFQTVQHGKVIDRR